MLQHALYLWLIFSCASQPHISASEKFKFTEDTDSTFEAGKAHLLLIRAWLSAGSLGEGVEKHLEAKKEEDVKDAGAQDASAEEEEEKLVAEMKKELAADKPSLETAPIAEKEWK